MTENCLPQDFEERIKGILPQRPASAFEPKLYQAFRINTLKISVEEALSRLSAMPQMDFQRISWCPYAILVAKQDAQELLKSDLVKDGLLYAQGLESILAVMVLDPVPGQRVLDLCAAPGSKTTQIAMHMQNTGALVANEPVRDRFYRLKSVVHLMGATSKLISIDGRRLRAQEGFDRILVDAPCSCEGRFLIHEPKSFKFWSLRKIKEMSHKQKGLLLNASRLLNPGGILVYATCTFAPEENEEVVDWFLRKTQGAMKLLPVDLPGVKTYPCLPQWQGRVYENSMKLPARIYPDERIEGFFIAKFMNSNYK